MSTAAIHQRSNALAWTIWVLGATFYFYAFFQRVTPSVMVSDLMREFAATAVILGNLSAFYFFAYAGLQFPLGVLLDRFGPRRVMAASLMIAASGSLLFGLAESLPVAYLARLLIGGGTAVALIGTFKLATIWFPPHQFATITGITMFIGTAGAVAGQAPLAALIELMGWRATLIWAAGFGFFLTVLIWLIVRDSTGEPGVGDGQENAPRRSILKGLKSVLSNPQTWLAALISGLHGGPLVTFAGLWAVPFAMAAYGLDRTGAAFLASVVFIGFSAAAPFIGWISNRLASRKIPMIVGASLCLAMWPLILYLPDPPLALVYVIFFFYGFGNGGAILVFAIGREHNAPSLSGAMSGVVNTFGMGAVAVLQPVTGYLLDLFWGGQMDAGIRVYSVETFRIAFLIFPACAVAAIAVWLFVRETHCRQQVED